MPHRIYQNGCWCGESGKFALSRARRELRLMGAQTLSSISTRTHLSAALGWHRESIFISARLSLLTLICILSPVVCVRCASIVVIRHVRFCVAQTAHQAATASAHPKTRRSRSLRHPFRVAASSAAAAVAAANSSGSMVSIAPHSSASTTTLRPPKKPKWEVIEHFNASSGLIASSLKVCYISKLSQLFGFQVFLQSLACFAQSMQVFSKLQIF
jgi:hypothetical protein